MDIKVEEYSKIIVVRLDGEFFLGNIRDVELIWEESIAKNPDIIAIDCKKLYFIDSPAIGTLVKFLNDSAVYDIKLMFFDLSDSVIRVFQTAKLNRVFTITTKKEFEEKYLKKV